MGIALNSAYNALQLQAMRKWKPNKSSCSMVRLLTTNIHDSSELNQIKQMNKHKCIKCSIVCKQLEIHICFYAGSVLNTYHVYICFLILVVGFGCSIFSIITVGSQVSMRSWSSCKRLGAKCGCGGYGSGYYLVGGHDRNYHWGYWWTLFKLVAANFGGYQY